MSSRQSKTGSRSASRTRGSRGGSKSAGSGSSHTRSMSARRSAGSNTRRAAPGRSASSRGASSRSGSSRSASGRGTSSRIASSRSASQKTREISARSKRGRRMESASHAVKLLKQDHRAVEEALEEFESAERDEKQSIAHRICKMLIVHAQIEEELLYPAARDVLDSEDSHLVAEARVEHASVKDLIRQIEDREQLDEQYEAKVQVLGEYVKHHVGEEEKQLFPRLEHSSLDLDALGERLEERKRELMGEEAQGMHDGQGMQEEEGSLEGGMPGARSRGGRGPRSTGLHARRH